MTVMIGQAAKRVARSENAVLGGVLVLIVIVLAVLSRGAFIARQNVASVLLQSATRGIASVGQAFVILTGGIDLSLGGIAMIASCIGGGLMTSADSNLTGNPLPLSLGVVIMLLIGGGIGSANGALISRLGMPALIVTLAIWRILEGLGYQITQGYAFTNLPTALGFFGQGIVLGVPIPIILFIAVIVIGHFTLYHTTLGRSIYATGSNPVSAWLSGVNVKDVYLCGYLISGFLAVLSGLVLMSRAMSGSVQIASGLELDSIAAVTIGGVSLSGGKGTLAGVVIGVVILGVLNNGLNILHVPPAFQDIVKGLVILIAVGIDYLRRRRA